MMSREEILSAISELSVLELSELINDMEEKFGVSAAAAVAQPQTVVSEPTSATPVYSSSAPSGAAGPRFPMMGPSGAAGTGTTPVTGKAGMQRMMRAKAAMYGLN